jgi:hypothetical protein
MAPLKAHILAREAAMEMINGRNPKMHTQTVRLRKKISSWTLGEFLSGEKFLPEPS